MGKHKKQDNLLIENADLKRLLSKAYEHFINCGDCFSCLIECMGKHEAETWQIEAEKILDA